MLKKFNAREKESMEYHLLIKRIKYAVIKAQFGKIFSKTAHSRAVAICKERKPYYLTFLFSSQQSLCRKSAAGIVYYLSRVAAPKTSP